MSKFILILIFVFAFTFAQAQTDTLEINNNQVVFFSISQAEYDSLSGLENSEGLDELLSDFNYYTWQIMESYKDSIDIDINLSAAHFFHIKTESKDTLINRKEFSQIVGFIANNGKEFIVEEGVFITYDFYNFMKKIILNIN